MRDDREDGGNASVAAAPEYGVSQHYVGQRGDLYYAWQGPISTAGSRITAAKFQPFVKSTDVVLDFGCSGGAVLEQLECGQRIGVEVNPAASQQAVTRGIACVPTLDLVDNGVVGVAISNHVLEHIPSPIAALKQIREKLNPHGTLIICVPMDDWRVQKRYNPDDINHHLQSWTPLSLGHTLHESGYAVTADSIRIRTHAWPPKVDLLEARLPATLFNRLCGVWAIANRRRELMAVVRPY